jgi:hypothetical protein
MSYNLIIKLTQVCILFFLTFSLFGCFGGGSSAVTKSTNVLDSGTGLVYNSTNATTLAATDEFQNSNDGAASSQNPLEVINAHKAYGYGLTGAGETIAVMDTGFWTGHSEIDGKVTTYGTLDLATDSSSGGGDTDHGLFVTSIAAGNSDDVGIQGVAPGASLHLSSYNTDSVGGNFPSHWALATDNASTAVVQNNSWGIDYQIDDLKADISANGWTNHFGISQKWDSSGYTSTEASAKDYITALNNFQNHGVIVYALSNTSSYTDADFQAALPELFPELKEAWITAVNVEILGAAGSETYTLKSAPCGSTGAYCLGADGWEITGAAYWGGADSLYWTELSGTSFVAPQISGAVAILGEAFPNHTPEQLTDRLLASADNSFFNHDAAVTFGNGVLHGYDDEFGHGILDIYAALNPITSSSDNRSTTIRTGNTLDDNSSSFQLGNSRLLMSSSFGDSLQIGLTGEVGYTYDDLDGGFEYDLNSHVFSNMATPSVHLSTELNNLSNSLKNTFTPGWKNNFSQVAASFSVNDELNTALTIGASSLPLQSFFGSDIESSVNLIDYQTPYLEAYEGGVGVNATYQFASSRLLVGATLPVEQSNGQTIGSRKSLISSLEYGDPSNQSITLMAGLTEDKDSLLGSEGTSAFSLEGAKSITTFTALKAQKQLLGNLSLTGIATFGNTNMSSPNNSFVDSASDVRSSSVALIANMRNLTDNDYLSLFVNQPNRVDSGSMAIKIASLADSNRNISQNIKNIDLESSSRQLNYGFSYRKDLNEDLAFSVKHMITNNLSHRQDSNTLHSSYIGMNYKDIKFGFATNPANSSLETELSYTITL